MFSRNLIGGSSDKLAFIQQMYLNKLLHLQLITDETILWILYIHVYKTCLYVHNQKPGYIETDP